MVRDVLLHATVTREQAQAMSKPLRCRIGRHVWIRVHPPHGQPRGPDQWICSGCQKTRTSSIPLGMLGT